jgi:UDP-N-acetylglucosamine 2-epimerase (non-hydrolysing)
MRLMFVFGTRPEAIKMAPVIRAVAGEAGFEMRVCVTGQHREMLDQVLRLFGIVPDFDLGLMRRGQSLAYTTGEVLEGVGRALAEWRPDRVLVQGDTTTTFAGALAAYYGRVPVAHVEAGLRTGNPYAPWPEEGNRRLVAALADLHFAPTEEAAGNLRREGIPAERILVTGNTGVDALLAASAKLDDTPALRESLDAGFAYLPPGKRLILVTGHRRENFDGGLARLCEAMRTIAGRGDVAILYPMHLNPNVRAAAEAILRGVPDVHLVEPADYLSFVYLMKRSYLVVTDSGGIQEEAPSLGKPVLVTREITERPEAVAAGTVRLVGTDRVAIEHWTTRLLDDRSAYERMSFAHNPYGDGQASRRIVQRLRNGAIL